MLFKTLYIGTKYTTAVTI